MSRIDIVDILLLSFGWVAVFLSFAIPKKKAAKDGS